MSTNEKPGGSTPSQYSLPPGAKELQDLIEHRKMNFAQGNIFKAQYRRGTCSHSDELRDARKTLWFAQREVDRLEAEEAEREIRNGFGGEKITPKEAEAIEAAVEKGGRRSSVLEKREVPPPGFTPITLAEPNKPIPDAALLNMVANHPVRSCMTCEFEGIKDDAEPCVSCHRYNNWRLADDQPRRVSAAMGILCAMGL